MSSLFSEYDSSSSNHHDDDDSSDSDESSIDPEEEVESLHIKLKILQGDQLTPQFRDLAGQWITSSPYVRISLLPEGIEGPELKLGASEAVQYCLEPEWDFQVQAEIALSQITDDCQFAVRIIDYEEDVQLQRLMGIAPVNVTPSMYRNLPSTTRTKWYGVPSQSADRASGRIQCQLDVKKQTKKYGDLKPIDYKEASGDMVYHQATYRPSQAEIDFNRNLKQEEKAAGRAPSLYGDLRLMTLSLTGSVTGAAEAVSKTTLGSMTMGAADAVKQTALGGVNLAVGGMNTTANLAVGGLNAGVNATAQVATGSMNLAAAGVTGAARATTQVATGSMNLAAASVTGAARATTQVATGSMNIAAAGVTGAARATTQVATGSMNLAAGTLKAVATPFLGSSKKQQPKTRAGSTRTLWSLTNNSAPMTAMRSMSSRNMFRNSTNTNHAMDGSRSLRDGSRSMRHMEGSRSMRNSERGRSMSNRHGSGRAQSHATVGLGLFTPHGKRDSNGSMEESSRRNGPGLRRSNSMNPNNNGFNHGASMEESSRRHPGGLRRSNTMAANRRDSNNSTMSMESTNTTSSNGSNGVVKKSSSWKNLLFVPGASNKPKENQQNPQPRPMPNKAMSMRQMPRSASTDKLKLDGTKVSSGAKMVRQRTRSPLRVRRSKSPLRKTDSTKKLGATPPQPGEDLGDLGDGAVDMDGSAKSNNPAAENSTNAEEGEKSAEFSVATAEEKKKKKIKKVRSSTSIITSGERGRQNNTDKGERGRTSDKKKMKKSKTMSHADTVQVLSMSKDDIMAAEEKKKLKKKKSTLTDADAPTLPKTSNWDVLRSAVDKKKQFKKAKSTLAQSDAPASVAGEKAATTDKPEKSEKKKLRKAKTTLTNADAPSSSVLEQKKKLRRKTSVLSTGDAPSSVEQKKKLRRKTSLLTNSDKPDSLTKGSSKKKSLKKRPSIDDATVEQKRQQMKEAAEKGDYVTAGKLQKEVLKLEKLLQLQKQSEQEKERDGHGTEEHGSSDPATIRSTSPKRASMTHVAQPSGNDSQEGKKERPGRSTSPKRASMAHVAQPTGSGSTKEQEEEPRGSVSPKRASMAHVPLPQMSRNLLLSPLQEEQPEDLISPKRASIGHVSQPLGTESNQQHPQEEGRRGRSKSPMRASIFHVPQPKAMPTLLEPPSSVVSSTRASVTHVSQPTDSYTQFQEQKHDGESTRQGQTTRSASTGDLTEPSVPTMHQSASMGDLTEPSVPSTQQSTSMSDLAEPSAPSTQQQQQAQYVEEDGSACPRRFASIDAFGNQLASLHNDAAAAINAPTVFTEENPKPEPEQQPAPSAPSQQGTGRTLRYRESILERQKRTESDSETRESILGGQNHTESNMESRSKSPKRGSMMGHVPKRTGSFGRKNAGSDHSIGSGSKSRRRSMSPLPVPGGAKSLAKKLASMEKGSNHSVSDMGGTGGKAQRNDYDTDWENEPPSFYVDSDADLSTDSGSDINHVFNHEKVPEHVGVPEDPHHPSVAAAEPAVGLAAQPATEPATTEPAIETATVADNLPQQESQAGFYLDEEGVQYYLDDKGIEYYQDTDGDWYADVAPEPEPEQEDISGWFMDVDGTKYYVDKDGVEYYQDPTDGEYYAAEKPQDPVVQQQPEESKPHSRYGIAMMTSH